MIGNDMDMSERRAGPVSIGNPMLPREAPGWGAVGRSASSPAGHPRETQVTLKSALLPGPEVILQI